MRFFLKVLAIAVVLAGVFALAFALWGDTFERLFSQEACRRWFEEIRPFAWAVAIGLLVADIVLPIPATGVMAAVGSVYGPVQHHGGLARPQRRLTDGAAGDTLWAAERCQSGRMGSVGNRVCPKGYPGFESRPLRHTSCRDLPAPGGALVRLRCEFAL